MSRPGVIGLIVACLVAGVLIGIYVAPRMMVDQTGRQAARDAVGPAIQPAIRQVTSEAGRKAASELADKILAGAHPVGEEAQSMPSAAPVTSPVVVDRQAFTVTLPPAATVDPEDVAVGSERMITANVSHSGILCVVVTNNKDEATSSYDDALARFRGKVENATQEKPATFDSLRVSRTTAVRGIIKGQEFRFEIAQCEGWDKGCLIIVEYPEQDKGDVVPMMSKALGTFRMKQ